MEFPFSVLGIAGIGIALMIALVCVHVIYNLFFHPLRHFPGPLLHRATKVPFLLQYLRGTTPFDVLDMHNAYGPIVRVEPNQLAFLHAEAWKDIYGHRTGSSHSGDEMGKDPVFYVVPGVQPAIVSEVNREMHGILRKQLSHGFSDRAMREQEPSILGHVELLINRLREHCRAPQSDRYTDDEPSEKTEPSEVKLQALDMQAWYNWTTFDIIGDLAFGTSFGCLQDVAYHPWVSNIIKTIRITNTLVVVKKLHLARIFIPISKVFSKSRQIHLKYSRDLVMERIGKGKKRPYLIHEMIENMDKLNLSLACVTSNAALLILAGSETTATLLSGVTYLLLRNPAALKRATEEVRSSFECEDDITLLSVSKLSYMLACLNEALRCYPPFPIGAPRLVPAGGAHIAGTFIPEKTIVACWHLAMSRSTANWEDPDEYRPERFLAEGKNDHDIIESMQPFSMGPRNCIGRNLAYAEMRLILARILYNFDMQLADPSQQWMDNQKIFTIWQKPPLNVYLKPVSS